MTSSMSAVFILFWVFCLSVAFSQSLWLLLLSCSCAFSCNADDTHSFSRVSPLSLFIASRSWLPSRPTTWLVAIFSFKLLGLGLFVVFLPMSLPGFLVNSGISVRGFRPNRCLLQFHLTYFFPWSFLHFFQC